MLKTRMARKVIGINKINVPIFRRVIHGRRIGTLEEQTPLTTKQTRHEDVCLYLMALNRRCRRRTHVQTCVIIYRRKFDLFVVC